MNKKIFTSFLVLLAVCLFIIPKMAAAETPCTYLGHERLEHASACMNQGGGNNSRYLNNHHIQMVNSLSSSTHLPAQSYPYAGDALFYSHMAMGAALVHGLRYGNPYMYYYYFSPTLPTDIVDYLSQ